MAVCRLGDQVTHDHGGAVLFEMGFDCSDDERSFGEGSSGNELW